MEHIRQLASLVVLLTCFLAASNIQGQGKQGSEITKAVFDQMRSTGVKHSNFKSWDNSAYPWDYIVVMRDVGKRFGLPPDKMRDLVSQWAQSKEGKSGDSEAARSFFLIQDFVAAKEHSKKALHEKMRLSGNLDATGNITRIKDLKNPDAKSGIEDWLLMADCANAEDNVLESMMIYQKVLNVIPEGNWPTNAWPDVHARVIQKVGNCFLQLYRRNGEKEGSPQNMMGKAQYAYLTALKYYTQAESPIVWAQTKCALAAAMLDSGLVRTVGAPLAQEAAGHCRDALKVFTREKWPVCWAEAQMYLGHALSTEAAKRAASPDTKERNMKVGLLKQADKAYEEALGVLTAEAASSVHFTIKERRGLIAEELAEALKSEANTKP